MNVPGGACLVAILLAAVACSDAVRSHVYAGAPYDLTRHCLQPVTSIDVVAGPPPTAPCPPVCIVSNADDSGAQQVYASSMCAPYPVYPYESNAGSDPRCAEAIAAFKRSTLCEADGGVLNPEPDAASSAEAGD